MTTLDTQELLNVVYDDTNKTLRTTGSGSGGSSTVVGNKTPSDAFANPTDAQATASLGMLFDGTDWERQRVADAGTLSGTIIPDGVALVTSPGEWTVNSSPAAGSVASAVKAAGAAGVRHVCTAIHASLAVATAITAATFTVNLRDGASGAGTVLMSRRVRAVTADTNHLVFELSGLSIFGTEATAMTLEFTAAGEATTLQDCTLVGYSVGA